MYLLSDSFSLSAVRWKSQGNIKQARLAVHIKTSAAPEPFIYIGFYILTEERRRGRVWCRRARMKVRPGLRAGDTITSPTVCVSVRINTTHRALPAPSLCSLPLLVVLSTAKTFSCLGVVTKTKKQNYKTKQFVHSDNIFIGDYRVVHKECELQLVAIFCKASCILSEQIYQKHQGE